MQITAPRDTLLAPLQAATGLIERRHSAPILSNVLIETTADTLSVTATDNETELRSSVPVEAASPGRTTAPARKLVEICRSLPADATINAHVEDARLVIAAQRARFTLNTLPPDDFPVLDFRAEDATTLTLSADQLKGLIDATHFAMAHNDARYYLNGMLFEPSAHGLRAVATDGHRLALADLSIEQPQIGDQALKPILPRKAIIELGRALGTLCEPVTMEFAERRVRIRIANLTLTSLLVDGTYPDYERIIPDAADCDKHISAPRENMRQALKRASILSNQTYRTVRLTAADQLMTVLANNGDQEEANEEIEIAYRGESITTAFNVAFLLEALDALDAEDADLYFSDAESACLITPVNTSRVRHVVMPVRT